ncbi:MAG: hypothetical protein H7Z76_13420 [Methylotenera sp.]|nr:hypothetical protein [Flavobacterium sp.]
MSKTLGLSIVIMPPIIGLKNRQKKKLQPNPILRFSPAFAIKKQMPMLIAKKKITSILFVFI